MKKIKLIVVFVLLAAVACGIWCCCRDRAGRQPTQAELEKEFEQMEPRDKDLGEFGEMKLDISKPAAKAGQKKKLNKGSGAEEGQHQPTEEEKKAEAEEKLVDSFDALTDSWMAGGRKAAPTFADIDEFAEKFRQIPEDRRDECIHRALNLIPDENVMLLAGILMDKSMGEEIIHTVYNDVLNRSEEVKKPILQQIFQDRDHPCWKDTAWIFDVTGDRPGASGGDEGGSVEGGTEGENDADN